MKPVSDHDERKIQRQIASDPDAPEATGEQLAQARPFADALPALAASIRKARGRPRLDRTKLQVTIRLDADVLDRLRSSGPGWQSRINDALRKELDL